MKANETKFQDLVASNYQYVVPLFQRPYSWTKREWQQLWEDIKDLTKNRVEHFIGSIVNIPTPSVPAGVSKFLLIDGQQRMTTLFIVMMALRDKAFVDGDEAMKDEINDMIVNRHKKGDDYFKLMPTQSDRDAYKLLVEGKPFTQSPSEDVGVQSCYRFFKTRLASIEIRPVFDVISSQLSIVSIVLDPNDNPHVVFESLNAKGRSLSQSDLIRNYFFMRIHVNQHDDVNAQYWQPMQNALGDNMAEFIRHYLMGAGSNVRQPDVYQVLKQRIEPEKTDQVLKQRIEPEKTDILQFLQRMAQFGEYYQRILLPEKYEINIEIKERMLRLNTLQVTVAYPFLLHVYDAVNSGTLSLKDLEAILATLENYIFRRAICGVPTTDLNKMFPSLHGWIQDNEGVDFLTALKIELQKRKYPRDDEFISSLVDEPLYGGERNIRARFLLESLERSYQHKETVDLRSATIEHILPQTPDTWWPQQLGKDYEDTREVWLHTLGNLTLTAYNSEGGNKSFLIKQKIYADSNLTLNKAIAEFENWNADSIQKRGGMLADQALNIWKDFRPVNDSLKESNGEVNGTKPYKLVILKQEYLVRNWADVLRQTVKAISEVASERMDELRDAFSTWLSDTPFRRNEPLSNGMNLNTGKNPDDVYRICQRMVEFVEIGDEWQVFWE